MSERPRQRTTLKKTTHEELNKHTEMLLDLNERYKQAKLRNADEEERDQPDK